MNNKRKMKEKKNLNQQTLCGTMAYTGFQKQIYSK
jgi:hypothetical protein